MLAKKHRLNLKETDNRAIFATGFRWRSGPLQAFYDFKGEAPQVAVIAPKAQLPKASARNQLRRRCFAALPTGWQETKGLRLAVRAANSSAGELSQSELKEWFEQLFADIKKHTP